MATQKPISTISYNTEPFLKEKLDSWIDAHIIQAYQYIKHKGEDGDKDHIHLRIEPNKRVDPMDLQEELREYCIGQKKPLGCRPFRPSKEEDWFLYAVHDKDYLNQKYGGGDKGEKLPYNWQDIKTDEFYDLEIAFIRAKQKMQHSSSGIAHRLQNGEKPVDLIGQGENVYVVNAVMHSLSKNDYTRLQQEYNNLNSMYNQLIDAITQEGYGIELDENNKIVLSKPLDE